MLLMVQDWGLPITRNLPTYLVIILQQMLFCFRSLIWQPNVVLYAKQVQWHAVPAISVLFFCPKRRLFISPLESQWHAVQEPEHNSKCNLLLIANLSAMVQGIKSGSIGPTRTMSLPSPNSLLTECCWAINELVTQLACLDGQGPPTFAWVAHL